MAKFYICASTIAAVYIAQYMENQRMITGMTRLILKYYHGPQYIYNVNEMALLYKYYHGGTVQTHMNGTQMKVFLPKSMRLSVLVGSNACDEKLKPLVIDGRTNQYSLRGVGIVSMPCYHKFTKKHWMTNDLFWWWITKCFISKMEARHDSRVTVFSCQSTMHI